jgi:hypothetical protein
MNDRPEDPDLEARIEAEIERALGPGVGVLPPEVLEEARIMLRIGLRHHPDAQALLRALGPAPSVEKSDKVATGAFKNRKKAGNGGAR